MKRKSSQQKTAGNSPATKQIKTEPKDEKERPKRPASAFFLFCKSMREAAKIEKVDAGKQRDLGRRWRKMTDEEKKPYRDQGDLLKKKYIRAMADFEK